MKSQVLPNAPRNYDAALLFFACLALAAELSLLFHQLRLIQIPFLSEHGKQNASGIGELLQKSRSVQSRSPGSLSWFPLAEGDAILQDDTVMTGSGASAVIRMKEGTELVLEPYTLLRFGRDLDFKNGQLALEVNQGLIKLKSRSQPLEVAVGDRTVQLAADSEATLSAATASTSAELEVIQGKATVSASTEAVPIELKTGEKAALSEAPRVAQLLLESALPREGALTFTDRPKAEVSFSWRANGAEVLEWSKNPEMESVETLKLTEQSAKILLPPGKYYWRLRAGKTVSQQASFGVLVEPSYQVDTKITRAIVKEGMEDDLKWVTVAGAKSYRIRIAKDAAFKKIEKEWFSPGNETQVAGLNPGAYFWKVQAVHSEWGELPESKPFPLKVSRRMSPPQVKGAKVVPVRKPTRPPRESGRKQVTLFRIALLFWRGEAIARAPEQIPVEFSWEPVAGARAYRLEVSTTKNFKKVVSSSEGTRSSAVIFLPTHEKYFWRVAAIDEDGDLGSFSKVQSISKVLTVETPTRQVAEIPNPAPVMNKTEPGEPPRQRFLRFWFGYGGGFFSQRLQNQDSLVRAAGFPANRFVLGAKRDLQQSSLETHLWFQPLRYVSSSGAAAFTRLQWGLDAFASRLWGPKTLPLGLGFRVRTEQLAATLSSTQVSLGGALTASVLFGTDWVRGAQTPWSSSLWLELAPLGEKRGAGILWRNRLRLPWKVGSLSPTLEMVVNPYYRQSSTVPLSEWALEVTLALTLEFDELLPTLTTIPRG